MAFKWPLLWRTIARSGHIPRPTQEDPLAKGEQRSNKMAKKPKKDNSLPKESQGSDRPMPPVTAVVPRGKDKNK